MSKYNVYGYAEKCLRNYHANQARIKILTDDLRILRAGSDVQAQQYDKSTGQFYIGFDPVISYVDKVLALESQIRRLERNTKPITQLIQDLRTPYALDKSRNTDYLKIIELYYFGGNSLDAVSQEMHCSRSTLFYRRRGLIQLTVGYLGI